MTTLDRTQHDTRDETHQHVPTETTAGGGRPSGRRVVAAIVAVMALVVGGVAGWFLRGSDDSDALVAGGGDLSARQGQMVDLVRDAEQAWQDRDAAAVVALFAPDGTFEALDVVYRVDDGSLAAYVEAGTWTSLEVMEPMLADGNQIVAFHTYEGDDYTDTFTFTTTGDLLIASQVIG